MERAIASIHIGERTRRDLGDLSGLAASIAELGVLQPVVVDDEGNLIAGARRIAACKRLGLAEIPVHVAMSLDDALLRLKAERDENVCRKDFNPEEAVYMARSLEPLEREAARARQVAAGERHGRGQIAPPNFGEAISRDKHSGESGRRIAAEAGLSEPTLLRARQIVEAAEAEPARFAPLVEEMNRTGRVAGVYKKLVVEQKAEQINAEPPPMPTGPFRVIAMDPPWSYGNRAFDPTHRGASPYPDMSIEEIGRLPIADIAAEDAILWLWTTNAHMPEAFGLIARWGFTHKTILTWVKDRMGTGDWLRGKTEHCLMAVRGKPTVQLTNQTTALVAPMRDHSRKPDEFYALVEALCPGSKVELFARSAREGWAAYGDEV